MSEIVKFRCRGCAADYAADGARHAEQARAADLARAAWEGLAEQPGPDEAAAWDRYRAAFDGMDATARRMIERGVYVGQTLTLELVAWAMAAPNRSIALPACITCGGDDYEFYAADGGAAVGTVAKALRQGLMGPRMEDKPVRADAPPELPLPAQQENWAAAQDVARLRKDWADGRDSAAVADAAAVMAQLRAASLVLARQVQGAGSGRQFVVAPPAPAPPPAEAPADG